MLKKYHRMCITNIEARNGYIGETVTLTRNEWEELKDEHNQLEEMIDAEEGFESQLADAEEKVSDLQTELEEAKTEHENLEDELKFVKNQLDQAKNLLEKYSIDLIEDLKFLED